jgi:hypothetical protein
VIGWYPLDGMAPGDGDLDETDRDDLEGAVKMGLESANLAVTVQRFGAMSRLTVHNYDDAVIGEVEIRPATEES